MNLSASYNKIKYVIDPAGKQEKQKILLGIRQACREVKKQQKGTLKEQTLSEFIDEL